MRAFPTQAEVAYVWRVKVGVFLQYINIICFSSLVNFAHHIIPTVASMFSNDVNAMVRETMKQALMSEAKLTAPFVS